MEYIIDSFPGRELSMNGSPHLYFGGTSYLGLQTDAIFQDIYIKNLKKYGTNYSASRNANLKLAIYDKVEEHLAKLAGSESCVTLSSGYLAGQLIASTLHASDHPLHYAPNTHSALQLNASRSQQPFQEFKKAVNAALKTTEVPPVIFLDTIDIAQENYPFFNQLKELPIDKLIIVADDSHGIGIVGSNGGGSFKKLKELRPKELIVSCSLGKGFGIQAGAVFASKERIQECKRTPLFGGASPATPAALMTLQDGQAIFKEKRVLLQRNIQLFLKVLKQTEMFDFIENYPAFYFRNPDLIEHLRKNRIIITNFNYPNGDSPMISRIVISAAHRPNDIQVLAWALNSFKNS